MYLGPTLFLGDSMMVGTSGLVPVQGERVEIAKVGAPSTWALDQLASAPLSRMRNLVVLAGVNDLAGGRSAEAIADTVTGIWRKALASGLRVFGATLPPFKGWPSFQPLAPYEAKRARLNALLRERAAQMGVTLIPVGEALTDPADPERLLPSADAGDHLHPKKAALASVLASGASLQGPAPDPLTKHDGPSLLGPLVVLGIVGYVLWRHRR